MILFVDAVPFVVLGLEMGRVETLAASLIGYLTRHIGESLLKLLFSLSVVAVDELSQLFGAKTEAVLMIDGTSVNKTGLL